MTGASAGLGAELAEELARRGRNVTLVARREDRLRELAAKLKDHHRVGATVVRADLADEGERAGLRATLEDWGLSVVGLVNNAGFSTLGPVHRADRRAEIDLVRTDVEAVVDLCSSFVPAMVEAGRGAVLNVASTAGFQPLPGQAAYGAAKAFVLSYTWALRAETAGHGVTVSALCPGPVSTEFNQRAGWSDEVAARALPRVLWVGAHEVAVAAVSGLEQGRAVVIPGAPNRLLAAAGRLAPRALVAAAVARQHPALRDG